MENCPEIPNNVRSERATVRSSSPRDPVVATGQAFESRVPRHRGRGGGKQTLNALSLDLGFSMGTYYELRDIPPFSAMSHTPAEDKPYFRGRVSFMQVEVAWETINVQGVAVRLGGGVTGVLNPSNVECVAPAGSSGPSCGYPTTVFPVLVAGLGVAL